MFPLVLLASYGRVPTPVLVSIPVDEPGVGVAGAAAVGPWDPATQVGDQDGVQASGFCLDQTWPLWSFANESADRSSWSFSSVTLPVK